MKTLIVPCIGRSLLDGKPKYLARHPKGKLLLEKCIEGLPLDIFDRIIFSVLKEDQELYNAVNIICETLNENVEIVFFDNETSGPAETIYETIKRANIEGSVVIKDCDNYLKVKNLEYKNFVAGLDLNEWKKDIHQLRNKSFLVINEQKQVLDIFEKQFKSDVISLGLYGFNDANDFILAYEKLNDISYPIKKLYVSHIISYLIGYVQRVFIYIPCLEYENWGNEKVWIDVQKSHATYFIDLDHIAEDNSQFENLASLYKNGACLVGFTVNKKEYSINYNKKASSFEFKFHDIIYGVTHSNVKRVISSSDELKSARYDV